MCKSLYAALLQRAFAYKCLKNYQDAVADLQKVLQLEPSNPTALTQLEALERELAGASSDLVAANREAGHSFHATVMGVFDNVSQGRSSTLNGVSCNVSDPEFIQIDCTSCNIASYLCFLWNMYKDSDLHTLTNIDMYMLCMKPVYLCVVPPS